MLTLGQGTDDKNFNGDPDQHLDSGIYEGIFYHCIHKQYCGVLGPGRGWRTLSALVMFAC